MARITLKNLNLKIPVFDYRSSSLGRKLVSMSVGGSIEKNNSITVIHALKDINLTFVNGDRVGLYGHNGAGKSSFLKLLAEIYEPTTGTCKIEGVVKSILSATEGLEPSLSGLDNLYRIGMLRGASKKEITQKCNAIIEFSGLQDYITLPVRTYSAGMQMRLIFSVVTSSSADILLLDEFFAAGDEEFINKSREKVHKLISNSKILVFASHSKEMLKSYCNRILFFEHGKVREVGIESL